MAGHFKKLCRGCDVSMGQCRCMRRDRDGKVIPKPVVYDICDACKAAGVENTRCMVRFQPQAWINDYAVDIDPLAGIQIDVTDRVLHMGQAAALAIENCSGESDSLVEGLHDHGGPFSVYCEDAIRSFFAASASPSC